MRGMVQRRQLLAPQVVERAAYARMVAGLANAISRCDGWRMVLVS